MVLSSVVFIIQIHDREIYLPDAVGQVNAILFFYKGALLSPLSQELEVFTSSQNMDKSL